GELSLESVENDAFQNVRVHGGDFRDHGAQILRIFGGVGVRFVNCLTQSDVEVRICIGCFLVDEPCAEHEATSGDQRLVEVNQGLHSGVLGHRAKGFTGDKCVDVSAF